MNAAASIIGQTDKLPATATLTALLASVPEPAFADVKLMISTGFSTRLSWVRRESNVISLPSLQSSVKPSDFPLVGSTVRTAWLTS